MPDSIVALADLLVHGPRCICGHTVLAHTIIGTTPLHCSGPVTLFGKFSNQWGDEEFQKSCPCGEYIERKD